MIGKESYANFLYLLASRSIMYVFSSFQPGYLNNTEGEAKKIELPRDKTNKKTVRPVKTQISLDIRPV